MAEPHTDALAISKALSGLVTLNVDEYFVAFGPEGRQFIGTPDGYTATFIPFEIIAELHSRPITKVPHVSFGDTPDSWYFAFELEDGSVTARVGAETPWRLRDLLWDYSVDEKSVIKSPKVQLGAEGAFVIWVGRKWACAGVPYYLEAQLCQMSEVKEDFGGVTRGALLDGTIDNIQLHQDGSYYLKSGNRHRWNYESALMREQWLKLWGDSGGGQLHEKELAKLAYVAIDPHASTSDTFAFFLKQDADGEVQFTLHFGNEPVYARLTQSNHVDNHNLQVREPDQPIHFRWATSKKLGRPHRNETRELEMKKGEKIQVLQDMGRHWYIGVGRQGIKGWCHGSWLDFEDEKYQVAAYARYNNEFVQSLRPGQLQCFPKLSDYVDMCTRHECKPLKDARSSLGICIHDLQVLLKGSGCYSIEWLKEGRNMWHPDRFARYCAPERVEELKAKAEQIFVLYGILMEAI